MTTIWRAELPYIKIGRPPQVLNYVVRPQEQAQTRFRDRTVATLDIGLDGYHCRAVIDWLDVTVVLARGTQFQHLQRPIEERTGLLPFIKAQDNGAGGVATIFRIRFQETRVALVAECLEDIQRTHGFVEEPVIDGMEVSVDFTPKVSSEPARHRMVGVLARHLLPKIDIVADAYDRPRFQWDCDGIVQTRYLTGDRRSRSGELDLLRWPLADQAVPVDATFYVGRQHGRAQWKVMDKLLDRQNLASGTRVELPEEERRARVEVTLNSDELRELGIRTLESLRQFRFATLQGRYFQFMLPTFATKSDRLSSAVVAFWEGNRKRRFLKAGVVGLIMMDDATKAFHASHRGEVRARLKALGRKIAPTIRSGIGEAGTFVAYAELCRKVSRALEKLGERERLPAEGDGGELVGRKRS